MKDHEYTKEIVCPYCGHEKGDSWEYSENDGELECYECGMNFSYTRNVTVDYSTGKLCKENNLEHQWGEWRHIEPWESNGKKYSESWYRECLVCHEHDSTKKNPLEQNG